MLSCGICWEKPCPQTYSFLFVHKAFPVDFQLFIDWQNHSSQVMIPKAKRTYCIGDVHWSTCIEWIHIIRNLIFFRWCNMKCSQLLLRKSIPPEIQENRFVLFFPYRCRNIFKHGKTCTLFFIQLNTYSLPKHVYF